MTDYPTASLSSTTHAATSQCEEGCQTIRTVKLAIFIYKADYTEYSYRLLWEKAAPLQFSTHTSTAKAPEIKAKLMTLVKNTQNLHAQIQK